MQYCALEKEGFLGTFYERETLSEKAVILVGGSGEGRTVKVLQPCARKIGMTGLSLSTAYTLLCADGKITRSDAASAGENDDDGSKIPKGVQPCQCGQLDETGLFFQTNMVRRCLLCQRNCAARFRAGFWHF